MQWFHSLQFKHGVMEVLKTTAVESMLLLPDFVPKHHQDNFHFELEEGQTLHSRPFQTDPIIGH